MRICKVKPSWHNCDWCNTVSEYFDEIPHCAKCSLKNKTYELIDIKHGFFNDYAFVLADGKISKVSLDRVYDIQGVELFYRKELTNEQETDT